MRHIIIIIIIIIIIVCFNSSLNFVYALFMMQMRHRKLRSLSIILCIQLECYIYNDVVVASD
jgi:hypothetical protein